MPQARSSGLAYAIEGNGGKLLPPRAWGNFHLFGGEGNFVN